MKPIQEGRADTLMVWALDRLTRGGAVAALGLINKLEKHYGAAFYSLQEPFLSTATASDPMYREFMAQTLAWMAKWESQRKSDRLKAKVSAKRNRAASIGERGLWGRGKLASQEDVSRIRGLRDAGTTVRAIAAATGVSKSQVARILAVPPQAEGQAGSSPEAAAPSDQAGLGQSAPPSSHPAKNPAGRKEPVGRGPSEGTRTAGTGPPGPEEDPQ